MWRSKSLASVEYQPAGYATNTWREECTVPLRFRGRARGLWSVWGRSAHKHGSITLTNTGYKPMPKVKKSKPKRRVVKLSAVDIKLIKKAAKNRIENRRIADELAPRMGYQNFNRYVYKYSKELA